MAIYAAFWRGINVGGKNMIKMAELKKTLELMGLRQVQTYINSGNALFESEEPAAALSERIEAEVLKLQGVSSKVMLRTAEELERIVKECPYLGEMDENGKNVHVGLLSEPASGQQLDKLADRIGETDEFTVCSLEIYFLYRRSILESRLASNVQKLGKQITTRNMNTMNKLHELAQRMKA
ncbi:DUF1697 domain-containing protein [Paenibacillus chartarius]|uniref:DUF1697 domain-containing protein n=1 Tax=Paenibacillus chartarius TaxID=747481 RepID=A0ABV6DS91_9BACL